MTDRIIELAKQVMTEVCEHFGEDAPLKADLDLIHDEPGTQWYLQRFAELVRNDAVDATCQDSRHVPGCVDAGMQAAPMQAQFTDDELDLFRQWYNSVQDTNGGYLVELDHALFRKLRAIKEAPVQEPETVSVLGVKPNGEVVDTGVKAPMPPRMKARDFVNEMYGRAWIEDDGSDADMCFAVCEQFFEWLVAQGWAAQPRTAVKLSDSEIASDASRHWSEDGVDPIAFAHAIESAVWAKNGVTE